MLVGGVFTFVASQNQKHKMRANGGAGGAEDGDGIAGVVLEIMLTFLQLLQD